MYNFEINNLKVMNLDAFSDFLELCSACEMISEYDAPVLLQEGVSSAGHRFFAMQFANSEFVVVQFPDLPVTSFVPAVALEMISV